MTLGFKTALSLAFCLTLIGCSGDDEPKKLSAEELEERRQRIEKELEKEKARRKAIGESLIDASDKKLESILRGCRGLIRAYASSRNDGPFSNYLIDHTSADIYQYSAGPKAVMTDKERIAELRGSKTGTSFNTEFAILSTRDSFDGPQKSVDKYECELDYGPKAVRAKVSY